MSDVAPVTWLQFGDQVKRLMALREIDPILGMMVGCQLPALWPCCEPHQSKGFRGRIPKPNP